MNRNRYTYNPVTGEPMLTSVMCIVVSRDLIIELCRVLEHAASLPQNVWLTADWRVAYDNAMAYCGNIVREIINIPRNYYDLWMMRSILRAVVYAYLYVDFDAYFVEYKRRYLSEMLYNHAMSQFVIPIDLFGVGDDSSGNAIRLRLLDEGKG